MRYVAQNGNVFIYLLTDFVWCLSSWVKSKKIRWILESNWIILSSNMTFTCCNILFPVTRYVLTKTYRKQRNTKNVVPPSEVRIYFYGWEGKTDALRTKLNQFHPDRFLYWRNYVAIPSWNILHCFHISDRQFEIVSNFNLIPVEHKILLLYSRMYFYMYLSNIW